MKRKDPDYQPVSRRRQHFPKTGHSFYRQYMAALPERIHFVERGLALVNTTFTTLFADEDFVTLLRAESETIPTYLKGVLEEQLRHADEVD